MLKMGYAPLPAQLRAWAAAACLAEIGPVAHSLKGSLGSLMAAGPADLAARTQRAAEMNAPETPRLANELADVVENLIAELRARQGSPNQRA